MKFHSHWKEEKEEEKEGEREREKDAEKSGTNERDDSSFAAADTSSDLGRINEFRFGTGDR